MRERLPVLISVPHGGTLVPVRIRDRVCLDDRALSYYSDPATQDLYDMRGIAAAFLQSDVSRVIIDLNRPPYHLPPKYPDGVVKTKTSLGHPVWKEDRLPDLACIHKLLLGDYFPYHAKADRFLLSGKVSVALDCHAMVPFGLPGQPDAGKKRPLFCLSNNGDDEGHARPGTLPTCPADWIQSLRDAIRDHFAGEGSIWINHPFHGGFIMNAHYWHAGIPWIQIEMNRSLYEEDGSSPETGSLTDAGKVKELNRVFRGIIHEWTRVIGVR
ncbi:MAG: N-formylglutamate amidohydrolase [Methanolinea sp.]|jgi:formiminoglutamase|nr:N-formylglutamate amidohydrolase [Methanolinea sp.]